MPTKLPTKFYMVRLEGGEWSPKAKHKTLSQAMTEAERLARVSGKKATVISSFCQVEVIDGKAVWSDASPEQ